jgi:amidase
MAITEDDYLAQDAIALAGHIAGGRLTAVEALEAALARSDKVNPKINAITLDLAERARRELAAKTPTGPLAGVPFLLKDLGPKLAGTATTDACKLYADDIAETDSPLTALYKAAGLTIFGKTNTPELGLEPVTEPAMFGPTRNPWDLSRSSGGAAGGGAGAGGAGGGGGGGGVGVGLVVGAGPPLPVHVMVAGAVLLPL